jgi:hypothetical protein
MEHRCGTRHPADQLVYVRSHAGAVSSAGRLRSVSVSGGFIYTTLPIPQLARLTVRLVDANGRLGVSIEAHVIRRTADGFGLEWNEDPSGLLQSLIPARSDEEIRAFGM